jgi:hypothetical protein
MRHIGAYEGIETSSEMIYAGPNMYLPQHKVFLLLILVPDDVRTRTAMKYLESGINIIVSL